MVPVANARGLTALHATSEEVSEWINRDNPMNSESKGSSSSVVGAMQNVMPTSSGGANTNFTFICECFFMTARVLSLGLLKAFSDFKHLVQVIHMVFPVIKKIKW